MKESQIDASTSHTEEIAALEKKVRYLQKRVLVSDALWLVYVVASFIAVHYITHQFLKEFDELYRVDTQLLQSVEQLEREK